MYKGHNSKIVSLSCNQLALCNCRVKEECPIDGKCQTMDAVYDRKIGRKCIINITIKIQSTTNNPNIKRHFEVMCGI